MDKLKRTEVEKMKKKQHRLALQKYLTDAVEEILANHKSYESIM